MRIKLTELTDKIQQYFRISGKSERDTNTLTQIVIEQEMIGNQFSAVGELDGKHSRLVDKQINVKEEVVVTKPALELIKGNGRAATLITADYLEKIIQKAKTQGIYALGIYDSSYNDFFDVFCRRIAAQDCIALIFENGGPQGVVPFGGKTEVTGTNPLAFGIPTNKYPIIFDAATAMHAHGRIKQARDNNQQLPDNAYVDKDGNITTDPNIAYAVLPFGGFKGYAVNILVDILSGALVRGKSGLDMPLESPDRLIGTLIIVIDPAAFGEIKDFKDSTTKLANDILAVTPVDPEKPVRVPGFRGSERLEKFRNEGFVEIEDKEWNRFETALSKLQMAKGE